MGRQSKLLYVGTGRFVVAVDPASGEEVWRTKIPSPYGTIVTLLLAKDRVYVGHAGSVYCLDARSGGILWKNGLPKTGYGAVLLTMEGADCSVQPGAVAAQAAIDEATAHAAHAAT